MLWTVLPWCCISALELKSMPQSQWNLLALAWSLAACAIKASLLGKDIPQLQSNFGVVEGTIGVYPSVVMRRWVRLLPPRLGF
jgi:hypothetical protein